MAASNASSTQDLNESGAQALQALLSSVSPEDSAGNGQSLTSDQVRKISDKLRELLGEGALGAESGNQRRNEKGELLNEEGLPIVDITEPVSDGSSVSDPVPIFDDPDILPVWALSPAEKARRRADRERILDLLEEEERLEQEREEAAERERRHAELEKRKEAAKAELDGLRRAKELQKKMGKALLRNVIETREREERDNAATEKEEAQGREEKKKKPSKSVSFARLPEDDEHASTETQAIAQSQWGDVSLARLQRKGKSTLLTKAQMGKQPMKMSVVERHPAGFPGLCSASAGSLDDQDSDDESVPGSPFLVDSDEGEVIHSDSSDDEHEHIGLRSSPSGSDSSDTDHMSDDGQPVSWQDDDFDFAQHQREIALAYYEKRAILAADVSTAMRAHTHEEAEHEWDQPEVPLDATLASAPPKPPGSRFRSERRADPPSSTLASHSLGPSVLPSSQSSTLKSAIKLGKLENDQLIGEESDDDLEREAREILELLSRGEVTNVGPPPNSVPGVGSNDTLAPGPPALRPFASVSERLPTGVETAANADFLGPKPSKVSKFKLTLSQPHAPEGSPVPSPGTPLSTVERSSPKVASTGPGTPISVPSSSHLPERRPNSNSTVIDAAPRIPAVGRAQMPSMIVQSSSFRLPRSKVPPKPSSSSPSNSSPTVVESPRSASAAVESPVFHSIVIDSPSLIDSTLPSVSPISPSNSVAETAISGEFPSVNRPAVIVAGEVKESNPAQRRTELGGRGKRVSRFLAERI